MKSDPLLNKLNMYTTHLSWKTFLDRDEIAKIEVIKPFMYFCHENQDHKNAKEIADLALSMNLMSNNSTTIYMNLLYNAGLYEQVFAVFKISNDTEKFRGNFYTLAMAALYQHGSDEAFRDAMDLRKQDLKNFLGKDK